MANPKKTTPSVKQQDTKKKAPEKTASVKKEMTKKERGKKNSVQKAVGTKSADKKQPKTLKTPVKKEPVKKDSSKTIQAKAKPDAKPASVGKPVNTDSKAAKAVKPAPVSKVEKVELKKAPAKVQAVEKGTTKPGKAAKSGSGESGDKREQLRLSILDKTKVVKLPTFTLEEALEIAKIAHNANGESATTTSVKAAPAKPDLNKLSKAVAPTHVKAASLADILGFNPKKQKPKLFADPETIPEKYRRYYKLLIDLRTSLTEGLSLHSEETLRRSTKDDAGDLSSYGQHMADAGTDTFDRDFALSMVANEQEALTEIDAAIKRIENGTYGICEITQKPIAKERLLAVPFTRYSAEAQKDLEKNRMRVRTAAGIIGEGGDDLGRGDESSRGDDE